MIEQLQFSLRTAETPRLPSAWAYRIYGWLMAQLPADTAARLHEQGEHPLSQSLCFDAAAQTSVWTLNLLDEALAAQVRPLLAGCTTLELHGAPLQMEPLGSHSVENGLQLLLAARENPASRTRLWFRTPCAFKQAGRYAIYPQEFLLLQSLVLHWNTAFPDYQRPGRAGRYPARAAHPGLQPAHRLLSHQEHPHPGLCGQRCRGGPAGPAAAGTLERPALLCALRRHRDQNHPWHGRRIGGAAGSAAEVTINVCGPFFWHKIVLHLDHTRKGITKNSHHFSWKVVAVFVMTF